MRWLLVDLFSANAFHGMSDEPAGEALVRLGARASQIAVL